MVTNCLSALVAPLFCCAGLANYQNPRECALSMGVISYPIHLVKRCENGSWFFSKTGTRMQATHALEISMCPSLFSFGVAVAQLPGKWTLVQLYFCESSDVFPISWSILSVSFIVKFSQWLSSKRLAAPKNTVLFLPTDSGQSNLTLTKEELVLPIQLMFFSYGLVFMVSKVSSKGQQN